MKKAVDAMFVVAVFAMFSNLAFAEAMMPEAGSVRTYASQNGQYAADVKVVMPSDAGPVECTVKKGDAVLWSVWADTLPTVAALSDDGLTLVVNTWGWYDEAGSSGLEVLRKDAKKPVKIAFGEDDMTVHIRSLDISPDGIFCAVASGSKEHENIVVYDTSTGKSVSEKDVYDFATHTWVAHTVKAKAA